MLELASLVSGGIAHLTSLVAASHPSPAAGSRMAATSVLTACQDGVNTLAIRGDDSAQLWTTPSDFSGGSNWVK
jgi:hypothetical protein